MGAMASQITSLTTQQNIQAQIKENIKAPRHWALCSEFPAQMASNAEKVSIWWRRHDTPYMILLHERTQIWWLALPN